MVSNIDPCWVIQVNVALFSSDALNPLIDGGDDDDGDDGKQPGRHGTCSTSDSI